MTTGQDFHDCRSRFHDDRLKFVMNSEHFHDDKSRFYYKWSRFA